MQEYVDKGYGFDKVNNKIHFKCERFCKKTPKLIKLLESSETNLIG